LFIQAGMRLEINLFLRFINSIALFSG